MIDEHDLDRWNALKAALRQLRDLADCSWDDLVDALQELIDEEEDE